MPSRLPPSCCVAVDVDGTIIVGGRPHQPVLDYCRQLRAKGLTLILWSARGEAHARAMAERCHCTDLFHVITSKPGAIIDDRGWDWIRHTAVLRHPVPVRSLPPDTKPHTMKPRR